MNKSFSLGKNTIRRRDIFSEKNSERSAFKALQQRKAFQRLARDAGEIGARQNESQRP